MRVFELPAGLTSRAQGQSQGETFRPLIAELADIRLQRLLTLPRAANREEVESRARPHLKLLRHYDLELSEEFIGVAEGANLSPEALLILNHYTDFRDLFDEPLHPQRAAKDSAGDEGCSIVFARGHDEVFLGQTWDMHGSALPYVMMLKVPEREGRPASWLLSLVGCLGMAGLNQAGLALTINNLRSTDAREGVVWPALVRRVLKARDFAEAKGVLLDAPVGSGHHYFLASAAEAFGLETSGRQKEVVFEGESAHFVHTNHALNEKIARYTQLAPDATSTFRYDFLSDQLGRLPSLQNEQDLWKLLGSHENYPRSVCTHLSPSEGAHASLTCGALVMGLSSRKLQAVGGCAHQARPLHFAFTDEG